MELTLLKQATNVIKERELTQHAMKMLELNLPAFTGV